MEDHDLHGDILGPGEGFPEGLAAQDLNRGGSRPTRETVSDDANPRDETLEDFEAEILVIEREALNDTEEGKLIASEFVSQFGRYVSESVRPVLRQVAAAGASPNCWSTAWPSCCG